MELFIWLKRNKISAKKFSKMIGISEPSMSNILNKIVTPSLVVAIKILDATNGDIDVMHLLSEKSQNEWSLYQTKKSFTRK